MRAIFSHDDDLKLAKQRIYNADPGDLIEGTFFLDLSVYETREIAKTLAGHCRQNPFPILFRVFPDHVRDINDSYCMHALNLLIHLYRANVAVNWLPEWLGGGRDLGNAINRFVHYSLTHFATDHLRRNILLSAAALRRLFKALMVVDEGTWRVGHVMHVLERYAAPEDSWAQILSSPERHNLLRLDRITNSVLRQLVHGYSGVQERPRVREIETQLRGIWKAELSIVESVASYQELLNESGLDEVHPTELVDVVYDYLGHCILCITDDDPVWKNHILEHHRDDLEVLRQFGSWQARKWLGGKIEDTHPRPGDEAVANRFFLGDVETYRRLRAAYGYS